MPSSSRTRSRVVLGATKDGLVVDAPRWSPDEISREPVTQKAVPESAPRHDGPSGPSPVELAYERGFEEGVQVGAAREADKLADSLAALEAAMQALETSRPAWLDNITKNLQALAVAIAEQIVQRELALDADTIQELVTRALGQFPLDVPLTIRLNPRDLSNLSAASLEGPGGDLAAGREVRWRADPAVEAGGCMVEGPERLVDGRVDKALLRIYHELATNG